MHYEEMLIASDRENLIVKEKDLYLLLSDAIIAAGKSKENNKNLNYIYLIVK